VNRFTPARRLAPLLLWLATTTGSAQSPRAPEVTPARLLSPTSGEWLVHGRTYDNQRYSPLTQITTANAARLSPRWIFQLAGARDGIETTPIVADGVMYLTTSHNRVFAFDLRSRKKLWQYEHKLGHAVYCCGPVNRGLAIAGSRVFMATLDARLVALDRASGEVVWNVQTDDPDSAVSQTMAPLVVDSIVIVGAAGGEYGIRGSVSGYDLRDGHRVWRWYGVPSPEEGGWWGKWATHTPTGEDLHRDVARERVDSAKFAESWRHGGAPVWTTPAYDRELGLIYFGVGNPSPSNDGEGRPGDNLYNNSTVALDVRTGKLRWYHQHVPHDLWDYDMPNPPILARVDGRKLLMHATKTGWMYVFDAATGELLRRTDAFVPQQNLFVPPTREGVLTAPGPTGGANWPPSSYSPRTGLFYVSAIHLPFVLTREPVEFQVGKVYIGGGQAIARDSVPRGVIAALSPRTGRKVWSVDTDSWLWGGTLVTAGDVLFVGETTGWFRAYDARSGRKLWEYFCGAGVDAPAVSFALDGTQYVGVAAGGSRYADLQGDAVLVFALGAGAGAAPGMADAARPGLVPPVPQGRGAADTSMVEEHAGGMRRVGRFLSYNPAARIAELSLVAGLEGRNRGMSFSGGFAGDRVLTVPVGWTVRLRVSNADMVGHSAIVVAGPSLPATLPATPAIAGAATSRLAEGLRPRTGTDLATFLAGETGAYLIACGVPGHAASGMWIRLVVSRDITVPSYQ
jgi:PQQ-dependent dehydrogenase (methanol/ethanol family)